MNKIAILTTIYSSCLSYWDSFITSIKQQDINQFDIIVINEGVGELYVSDPRVVNVTAPADTTINKNRQIGIEYVIDNNYKYVVFADCDDTFAWNRFSVSIKMLHAYDIYVNDLRIVSSKGSILNSGYLSTRLGKQYPVSIQDIQSKNFLGLSNTAVRVKALEGIDIPNEVIAVDWYIFSILLKRGNKAIFTSDTHTNYMQHSNNMIGIGTISSEIVRKSVITKYRHYCGMVEAGYNEFYTQYEYFLWLEKEIKHGTSTAQQYIEKVSSISKQNPFWWEIAKKLEG